MQCRIEFSTLVMIVLLTISLVFSFMTLQRTNREPKIIIRTIVETVYVPTVTTILEREEISRVVQSCTTQDQMDIIANYYNQFVRNIELTYLIIGASMLYDIPINILFALISTESNFDINAINNHNGNGTSDYGLMQLNSSTFSGYSKAELMDKYINLQKGCNFLRNRYEKYGTWEEAIMRYNGSPQKAVKYQIMVLAKEAELDKGFNENNFGEEVSEQPMTG